MGFLDYLNIGSWIIGDPSDKFDRTNVNQGIFQARESITQALSQKNPLLESNSFSALVLWVSNPVLEVTPTLPLSNKPGFLEYNYVQIPSTKIKIYFRVPVLHSNLPLPNSFHPEYKSTLSNLKPEDQNELLISCHPSLYADFSEFSNIIPGDIIKIEFDDKTYSSAKLVELEKKGINNIEIKTNFTSSIVDIFDDAAETAILGSPDEKKYTNVIYELEDKLEKVGNIIHTAGWPMTTSAVDTEYKRWQKGALKETNSGAYPYLKEYWDNIGITEWTPAGTPWSAAFISFLLRSSGFPGASSHRSYTKKIIERDTPWSAYSVPKNKGRIRVGIGDVVVAARGDGSVDDYKKTHGDVVYKIETSSSGFKAYTAGGNLGNTAKDGTPLSLDGEKNLLNAGKYVIILKYGSLIAV